MQMPFSAFSGSSPRGDDAPGARLFEEHAAAIFAYLRLRTATREEAEDLLLEVFLAAFERGSELEGRTGESQRAWLRGAAAHKVADHGGDQLFDSQTLIETMVYSIMQEH